LCALRWRHVDLAQDVLVIQAGIAQANGEVWETDTELHQRRHVALDPVTIAVHTTIHKLRHGFIPSAKLMGGQGLYPYLGDQQLFELGE
jgi:hypothetical protein